MEVERLQHQLTEQEISPDDFFAILLSMYELETSKNFLRIIIQNLKTLMDVSAWGGRYRELHKNLTGKYEEFFCETIADKDDIYWSDDDERMVEENIGKLELGSSDEFDDDKGGNPEEAALAFNLSLTEVEADRKLCSKNGEGENRRRRRRKKKDEDSVVLLWFRRDLRLYDNPALVTACSLGKPVRVILIDLLFRHIRKSLGDPSLFVE